FVVKYSANRKLIWAKAAGGPDGECFPTAISLDQHDLLVIVGSFTGSVILSPGQNPFRATSHGGEDAFIVQLDQDTGQAHVYSYFGGPLYRAIRTVDASLGYPLVGGVFTKRVHFPQAQRDAVSAGGQDGFLFRYIYDANVNGFITIGGPGYDAINEVVHHPITTKFSRGGQT